MVLIQNDSVNKQLLKQATARAWQPERLRIPTHCKVRWGTRLNGIAYDQKNDRLFVTGKLWPKLFEIKLVPGTK